MAGSKPQGLCMWYDKIPWAQSEPRRICWRPAAATQQPAPLNLRRLPSRVAAQEESSVSRQHTRKIPSNQLQRKTSLQYWHHRSLEGGAGPQRYLLRYSERPHQMAENKQWRSAVHLFGRRYSLTAAHAPRVPQAHPIWVLALRAEEERPGQASPKACFAESTSNRKCST